MKQAKEDRVGVHMNLASSSPKFRAIPTHVGDDFILDLFRLHLRAATQARLITRLVQPGAHDNFISSNFVFSLHRNLITGI